MGHRPVLLYQPRIAGRWRLRHGHGGSSKTPAGAEFGDANSDHQDPAHPADSGCLLCVLLVAAAFGPPSSRQAVCCSAMPNTRAPRPHGPSHSAPYGKACMHCFKAKSRCVARPEGGGCERCFRLRKTCHPSDPIRKRAIHKNQNSIERVAQLEGKLDTLVTLLHTVTKTTTENRGGTDEDGGPGEDITFTEPTVPPAEEERPSIISPSQPQTPYLDGMPFGRTAALTPDTTAPGSLDGASCGSGPAVGPRELSDDEAEDALSLFRLRLLPLCPFIYFQQGTTAKSLRQHRPFLMRCIIAVTQPSTYQKLLHGKCVKKILAQSVLVDNRSTIDLLLGLLVYVTWGYDSMIAQSGTLSRLVMVALSIVSDLRLNQPLPPDEHMIVSYLSDFHKCRIDEVENGTHHVWEQHRAILGCFLVTSFVSVYFAQIDSLRWTPRMAESLKAVSNNKDCQSDQTLAFQVRLQLILLKAVHIRDEAQWESLDMPTKVPRLSVHTAKVLLAQVHDLRASLPTGADANLLAHTYYVDLSINENVYSAKWDRPIKPSSDDSNSLLSSDSTSTDRIECYWRSVHAIQKFMEAALSAPAIKFIGLTFPMWAQLSRNVVTLYRLSTLNDPLWDSQAVRSTVDMLIMVDRFSEKMELAATDISQRAADSTIAQVARMMRMFRAAAANKLSAEQRTGPDSGQRPEEPPDMWEYDLMIGQANEIYGADRWLNNLFVRF